MNKSMKSAQSGFTLIELIVVIVILGILAATALPKFANLGADARLSSLQAAKGALSATAAMAHGKYLANSGAPLTTLNVEGTTINFPTAAPMTGYPKADASLVEAAGLTSADYTIYPAGHDNDANSTSVLANEVMIVPNSVAKTPAGLKCYVKYKAPTSAGAAPVLEIGATSASDCE